jgi:hypothetical protein
MGSGKLHALEVYNHDVTSIHDYLRTNGDVENDADASIQVKPTVMAERCDASWPGVGEEGRLRDMRVSSGLGIVRFWGLRNSNVDGGILKHSYISNNTDPQE